MQFGAHWSAPAGEGADVRQRPTQTREELAALIMDRLKARADCAQVIGVVIAPIQRTRSAAANWHAAFTTQAKAPVPRAAWQIGSQIAAEFDLVSAP